MSHMRDYRTWQDAAEGLLAEAEAAYEANNEDDREYADHLTRRAHVFAIRAQAAATAELAENGIAAYRA